MNWDKIEKGQVVQLMVADGAQHELWVGRVLHIVGMFEQGEELISINTNLYSNDQSEEDGYLFYKKDIVEVKRIYDVVEIIEEMYEQINIDINEHRFVNPGAYSLSA